ncbi:cell division protein FtsQ/DivIB [Aliikangiella maris]|uniref:FtsQ-type POTRA domain-containing protein n=2 Tax=Aliikangiella maris TaxID=3162458 RepID=A0ABV3MJ77_9GAMM
MSKMAVRKKSKSPQRFSFKPVAVDWPKIKLVGAITGILAIVGIIGQMIKASYHLWPIEKVIIQGDFTYMQQSNLVALVNELPEKGMLFVDLNYLQAQAQQIDWIKRVEVQKIWPETLVFHVEEHMPVARFNQRVLTQHGEIINIAKGDFRFEHFPQVAIASEVDKQNYYPMIWREFKTYKKQFELIELELLGVTIDQASNWHMQFVEGINLNLGRKDRKARVTRLVNVYSAIVDKEKIKSIDLRYHNGLAVEWFENQSKENIKG